MIELHIHQSVGGFYADAEVFPLVHDAGLQTCIEVLDFLPSVEWTMRIRVYVIGVIVRAECEHGA